MSLAAPRLDSRRSSGLYVDRVGRTKGSSRLDAGHILYRWESKDQRVPWVRTGRGRRPRLTIHPRPYGGAAGPTTALRARRRRGYTIRSSSGSPAPLDPTRGQRRRGRISTKSQVHRALYFGHPRGLVVWENAALIPKSAGWGPKLAPGPPHAAFTPRPVWRICKKEEVEPPHK